MALYGPAIPVAHLLTAEGTQEVHPASERWWERLHLLRLASQEDRLRCPDCDERLLIVLNNVPVPFFKHYRDIHGCVSPGTDPDRDDYRGRAFLRHLVVVTLRRLLPAAASIECEGYLAGRQPSLMLRLADGRASILEVVTESPDMAAWGRRRAQYRATGLPVFYLFAGERVPSAISGVGEGATNVRIDGTLNPDMVEAMRTDSVDIAQALRHHTFGLTRLEKEPGSLFFFVPGRSQVDGGSVILVRGLLPHPDVTAWSGLTVRRQVTEKGASGVRFSQRHGFYTPEDCEALLYYRNYFRSRRATGHRLDPLGPPASRTLPMKTAWIRQRDWFERKRLEAEVAQAKAEQAEQERIAAAERRREEAKRQADAEYNRVLDVLREVGGGLLAGRELPVHEDLYCVPAAEWQALLVGFVYMAGLSFHVGNAAGWLRSQGLVARQSDADERENMRYFWRELDRSGVVLYHSQNEIEPVRKYTWPIRAGVHRTAMKPAVCIMCATVHRTQELGRAESWRVYDPEHDVCMCTACP